jgi:hypothetical protein
MELRPLVYRHFPDELALLVCGSYLHSVGAGL